MIRDVHRRPHRRPRDHPYDSGSSNSAIRARTEAPSSQYLAEVYVDVASEWALPVSRRVSSSRASLALPWFSASPLLM